MKRAIALALLLAACSAATARADGDPASDYLYTQKLFVPFDVKASKAKQQTLVRTIEGATRAGFPIRVAIIASPYDLGAVPSLWRKPTTYARFLGAELAFVYKQRLLIVMPNGFGFYWKGHPAKNEYAVLNTLRIGTGGDGLVDAATTAVSALAAQVGIRVQQAAAAKSTTNRDRVIVAVAAVVLIALAALGRLALRRRR
jgi:hypothetical protein